MFTSKVMSPLVMIDPLIDLPPAASTWFSKVAIMGSPSKFGIRLIEFGYLKTRAKIGVTLSESAA